MKSPLVKLLLVLGVLLVLFEALPGSHLHGPPASYVKPGPGVEYVVLVPEVPAVWILK